MLSTIKAIVPENLIFLAQKTPKIPVAIVCAHHASAIESAKQACDSNLIEPIFIDKKTLIIKEATNISWNIENYLISYFYYLLYRNTKAPIIVQGPLMFFVYFLS